MLTCMLDRILDRALGGGPGKYGVTKFGVNFRVSFVRWRRLIVFESLGKLVSVVEYVLNCAWHDHHPKNLSRAFIA